MNELTAETFESLRQALIELKSYAVAVRYPGGTVDERKYR